MNEATKGNQIKREMEEILSKPYYKRGMALYTYNGDSQRYWKLFSKRHNLYNDEAIKRYKFREFVGGVIVLFIIAVVACIFVEAIYLTAVGQLNMGPVK